MGRWLQGNVLPVGSCNVGDAVDGYAMCIDGNVNRSIEHRCGGGDDVGNEFGNRCINGGMVASLMGLQCNEGLGDVGAAECNVGGNL